MWIFLSFSSYTQEFFIIDADRRLVKVDIRNCTANLIENISFNSSITDISFHPNGKLYGVSTGGKLVEINTETGFTTLIHQFDRLRGEFFTSLVADQNGVIYATGTEGLLYSFDVNNANGHFHGQIPFGAAGDLTFFQGRLFMASTENEMVEVKIDHPENSEVFMDFNVGGNIFGIVTFVQDCDQTVTYATTNHGHAKIFAIDLADKTLAHECTIPYTVYGAASELEHIASNPIVVNEVTTGVSNCGARDGSIQVMASGGIGTLNYSLNGGVFQPNFNFNHLAPGVHVINIKDESSCKANIEVEVPSSSPPPVIEEVLQHSTHCGEPNGALQVIAGAGTGALTYSLDNINFQNEAQFNDLTADVYSVFVKDELGCLAFHNAEVASSKNPKILDLEIKACGSMENSASVVLADHPHPMMFSLNGASFQAVPTFSALAPGEYMVRVQDTLGCKDEHAMSIPEVAPLSISAEAHTACTNQEGSINVLTHGGTGTHHFRLNGGALQETPVFTHLNPGNFEIAVEDEFGCTSSTSITINPFEELAIQEVISQSGDCAENNGSVEIHAHGGHGQLQYILNERQIQVDQKFQDLGIGEHTLAVIDEKGCEVTSSTHIFPDCPVYIPNAFSPNNDGVNDIFQVFSPFDFQVEMFRVFDRWGGLLFENKAFSISEISHFWDGKAGGKILAEGIYLYQIEITNEFGEKEFYAGDVTLIK